MTHPYKFFAGGAGRPPQRAANWPHPAPTPLYAPARFAAGPGSSGSVNPSGYTLQFPNNFPDSTFVGISFPGLCGGMVFTVLDYAFAGVLAPTTTNTPSTNTPLGSYIQERQADTILEHPYNAARFVELLANPDDDAVAETTNEELATLKAKIDHGAPAPLGLIPSPWTLDVTQAHQVLATGYRTDADGTKVVVIWDSNRPRQYTELRQAPGFATWSETGGDVWRGFFVTEYSRKSPPAA